MHESTQHSIVQIGQTIRNRRKALGYSQQELADLVGLNQAYVSQLERGVATIQLVRLVALLHQLGFDLTVVPRGR